MPRRIHVISCAVLAVDIRHAAAELGIEIAATFLEGGLHERPQRLRAELQRAIDHVSASGSCDRIVVGYGVCGQGTVGVRARNVPLVIPRVHDCVALFLGGDRPYRREFQKFPGTFYISAGWHEGKPVTLAERRRRASFGDRQLSYDELVETYGPRVADATFRFLNSWQRNYQRAAFIDTGAKPSPEAERHAREMAAEYGWVFEKIDGSPDLIRKMLSAEKTTDDILIVAPRHVIDFDAATSTLTAHPEWVTPAAGSSTPGAAVVKGRGNDPAAMERVRIGLGVDAGGTYTDAVIYDLHQQRVLSKSKALTTRWDFTVGISKALDGLDRKALPAVTMVALSTTLATNAIVEGDGQKVGMILMSPFEPPAPEPGGDAPQAMVAGQLNITGQETCPVDEDEVRRVVRRMVEKDAVRAFAVSGYAGTINPAHELRVKAIIREETGLFVTCGHELSDILDFKVRARTALYNARIIPRLVTLLADLERVLGARGIQAPVVVVKGDGTFMSAAMAKARPVETILSGPAASVAGARRLTGRADALVVDMGGTTLDTARLVGNRVALCETGSLVGGRRTHVKALDIRSVGLGGDSMIRFNKNQVTIGPRRVAPVAWLGATFPGTSQALDFLERHLRRYASDTSSMTLLALTGAPDAVPLAPVQEALVDLLKIRPRSVDELLRETGACLEGQLELKALESRGVVQRCGLTPTDLLHVAGRMALWDPTSARRICHLFSVLSGREMTEMVTDLLGRVTRGLVVELLKQALDSDVDTARLHDCPVCETWIDNLMAGGNDRFAVHIDFKQPVVGIGGPIGFFLPRAAAVLGTQAVLPPDADVANAIGAITSLVVIQRQLRIVPVSDGGFSIEGLAGARTFDSLDKADGVARKELIRIIRAQGRIAGTSAEDVFLETEDQLPKAANGATVFIGRLIRGSLSGPPDLVLQTGKASEIRSSAA